MTQDGYNNSDLARLIVAATEGELSDADRVRLIDIMRTSPQARERYVSHMLLHGQFQTEAEVILADIPSDLHDSDPTEGAKRASSPQSFLVSSGTYSGDVASGLLASPEPRSAEQSSFVSARSAVNPLSFPVVSLSKLGILATAVCLGILIGRWYYGDAMEAPNGNLAGNTSSATPVAYLTSANGCAWGAGLSEAGKIGSGVQLGDEITLYEGIAEFRLSSGVSLSIEGPAALAVTSPTSLIFQYGKMTIHVPWVVTDFRLMAASCRITASEAEFGVHVAGGEIDVHAFSGQALMSPTISGVQRPELVKTGTIEREADLAPGSGFSEAIVAAGRGLAVVSSGEIVKVLRWHSAKETEFATKLPMAGLLPVNRTYVDSVLKSKPIHYWRFEESTNGAIANEIAGEPALKASGEVRFGRGSQNHAAELGRPGSEGFLYCETPLNLPSGSDYSIELWIKPSHIHDGSIVSLTPDLMLPGRERHAFYLQLCGPHISYPENGRCRVRFLHRDPPQSDYKTGTSCFSADPYALRRWQHVACVKNGPEMRLYIGGKLVAKEQENRSLEANLYLVIGQAGAARRVHPFIGQLDELAIYDRALSQAEITLHVQAVDWESPHAFPVKKNEI